MEKPDVEKGSGSEDTSTLNRNRSFKSKQLVRSQAIRESTSPPRTSSPSVVVDQAGDDVTADVTGGDHSRDDRSSDVGDDCRRQRVEIQITPGAWDDPGSDQRQRTKRWLGNKQLSRDLLSNNPRVECVCGACSACPHCRGRRRKYLCPTKQDSGIVCSDDCPDCSDTEPSGASNANGGRNANSFERDEPTYYCRCPERKEKPRNMSLGRTDSDELTGPELVKFIKDTLNKNARDRLTLLKIERELHSLINDTGRCVVRFPVMTSYGRMLVHRCASLFQLNHQLDHSSKTCVLVSKLGTCGGRIPCTSFKQWCTATFPPSPQRSHDTTLAKSILKRDTHSLDEPGTGPLSAARSKSLEQREREYERVRRRIFSSDNCSQDESSQWQWLNSGPIKLLTPEGGRNKLVKVQSLEGSTPPQRSGGVGSGARGAVSKSHSFGGYARAPDAPRALSRQGDLASSSWRVSPSSSGYRTLSLHSATPSPTGGASPEPAQAPGAEGVAVMWAVTDFSSVPVGALVIHPQTGRPLTNPDGSLYHFDPANPPAVGDATLYTQAEPKIDANSEKKRGRLEKQHSFIDNECECQPSEECRSKCYCECRRHDSCHSNSDKSSTQNEQKNPQTPTSPAKTRYEQPVETPTNQNPPPDIPTNHRPPYDAPTNQKPAPENPANQRSVYDVSQSFNTNIRPAYDTRTPYEANHRQERQFEIQRPPSYDTSQKYDPANQRGPVELANHRAMRMTNHGTPEMQYISQQYQQGYPHEETAQLVGPAFCVTDSGRSPPQSSATTASGKEPKRRIIKVTSPQACPQYLQQDMAQHMAQVTPVSQDHNMRPMSLGVVYPGLTQYYGSPLPVYQPMQEEQKQAPSNINNNTFTIDPSYPYAPVDYASQCCEPTPPAHPTLPTHPAHPALPSRPYAVYAPIAPVAPEPVIQYQHHYPYQDPMQWQGMQPVVQVPHGGQKLFVPELYPFVQYPAGGVPVYPQYNVMYPQVVPQAYPVYQTVHQVDKPDQRRNSFVGHRHSKRNSVSGSSRNTPLTRTPEDKKVPYDESHSAHSTNPAQNINTTIQNTILQTQNQSLPSQNQLHSQNLNVSSQNQNLQSQNTITHSQNTNLHSQNSNLHSHNTNLQSQNANVQSQNANLQSQNQNVSRQNQSLPSQNQNVASHKQSLQIQNSDLSAQVQTSSRESTDLAAKIKQINDQMSHLNTRDHREYRRDGRRDEWKRRNSGNGILGNYPFNGRRAPMSEQNQLSSAARAIVHSIRSMQANNHYQDRRPDYNHQYRHDRDKPDYRNRRDDKDRADTDRRLPVYTPSYLLRQMSPGTWCRRSPAPIHPVLNPRRPQPDSRGGRR